MNREHENYEKPYYLYGLIIFVVILLALIGLVFIKPDLITGFLFKTNSYRFSERCDELEGQIRELLSEANYCTTDDECELIRGFPAPFKPFYPINKNFPVKLINRAKEKYTQKCVIESPNSPEFEDLSENSPDITLKCVRRHCVNVTDAIVNYNLAWQEYKDGRYHEALKLLNKVLYIYPTYPEANYLAGEIYYKLKQYKLAASKLELASTYFNSPDDRARTKYLLGMVYQQLGMNYEALRLFKECIKLQPDNSKVLLSLTELYLKLDRKDEALSTCKRLTNTEDSIAGLILMAKIYLSDNNYKKAVESLKRALAQDPDNLKIYILLAKSYIYQKEYNRAVNVLMEAEKRELVSPELLLNLGTLNLKLGKLDRAKLYLSKVQKGEVRQDVLLMSLTELYLREGKVEIALDYARELLKLEPDSYVGHLVLGMAYLAQDEPRRAVNELIKAINRNPRDPRARLQLAIAYERMGNYKRALDYLNTILDVKEMDLRLEVYYHLGKCYIKIDRPDDALPYLTRYLKSSSSVTGDEQLAEVVVNLAEVYRQKRLPQKAIDLLRKYMHDFKSPELRAKLALKLADIYEDIKEEREAIETLEEIVKQGVDSYQIELKLGLLYYKCGDPLKAIDAFKAGLRFKPDSPELHYNLGIVYISIGAKPQAIEEYHKLEKIDRELAGKLYKKLSEF